MVFRKKAVNNEPNIIPEHVGIIMDGNGRWAKKRGLPRSAGHSAGASAFKNISLYCNKIGVKYLTAYAFSTENWKRPVDEVNAIMKILRDYLRDMDSYKDENIRTLFIGDRSVLDEEINNLMTKAEESSKDATGLTLNIAINYGGRSEIITAFKTLYSDVISNNLDISKITEQDISDRLYTSGQPDPDFIIRPSGELRTSNFMLWQSAYSEFIFMDTLWPDFKPSHLDFAINEYNKRSRRFGGV